MAAQLKAVIRTARGKGPARRLRQAGKIPAVIYGGEGETHALTVEQRDLDHLLQAGERLVNVVYESGGQPVNRQTLIKELQQDAISLNVLHVDFYEVAADMEINVKVAIRTVGTAAGEATGGTMAQEMHELEVTCLPTNIPDEILVDVSGLELHQGIHVGELALPRGVTAVADEKQMVAHVMPPRGGTQDGESPEEAEVEGGAAEVEVIGEKKDKPAEEGGG